MIPCRCVSQRKSAIFSDDSALGRDTFTILEALLNYEQKSNRRWSTINFSSGNHPTKPEIHARLKHNKNAQNGTNPGFLIPDKETVSPVYFIILLIIVIIVTWAASIIASFVLLVRSKL